MLSYFHIQSKVHFLANCSLPKVLTPEFGLSVCLWRQALRPHLLPDYSRRLPTDHWLPTSVLIPLTNSFFCSLLEFFIFSSFFSFTIMCAIIPHPFSSRCQSTLIMMPCFLQMDIWLQSWCIAKFCPDSWFVVIILSREHMRLWSILAMMQSCSECRLPLRRVPSRINF